MIKTRTHLAIIAMIASMSLLGACSKEDNSASGDSTAAPAAPAEPAAPAAPGGTPDAGGGSMGGSSGG